MRESRTYGSVRGALSNERPYRVPIRAFTLDRSDAHSTSATGLFRPINDVCAMFAFRPIATKLLHYGK